MWRVWYFNTFFLLTVFCFQWRKTSIFKQGTINRWQLTVSIQLWDKLRTTVFISFISRGMQFGADQSSEVQWLSSMVLSSAIQGSAVWWSQAQTKTVQSSEVQCRPVQSSEVLSGSVQSSPVHWCTVQSIQWNLRPSSPIPIHSLLAKYISIQRRPGPYKSTTAVESSPVNCSAEQCNS